MSRSISARKTRTKSSAKTAPKPSNSSSEAFWVCEKGCHGLCRHLEAKHKIEPVLDGNMRGRGRISLDAYRLLQEEQADVRDQIRWWEVDGYKDEFLKLLASYDLEPLEYKIILRYMIEYDSLYDVAKSLKMPPPNVYYHYKKALAKIRAKERVVQKKENS